MLPDQERLSISMSLDTVLCRKSEIPYASIDAEEAVMLDVIAGKYYGLNATAARIWELLDRPIAVRELSRRICDEFEVDPETCDAAVSAFALKLVGKGLVDSLQT